jgi:hypothetical protein
MKQDEKKTVVVFRKFKDGDIIAIFPEINWNFEHSTCSSYMQYGEHGACSYDIVNVTKLATPDEYKHLEAILETICGYNLAIKKKIMRRWYEVNR